MKKSSKAKQFTIKDIAAGKWATTKFFLRRIPEIVVLAALAFLYIDNEYYCISQEIKIAQLKQEIQEVKSEALKVEAELTQMCIQSNIERMVIERGLDIGVSQQSKIVIKSDDNTND